jgi:F-type H+-transporting ATPase subunit epsilon
MATLPTKLTLHIVTPDRSQTVDVDEVSLPGSEGDFGVLPGHTPFFTSLRTGPMSYRQGTARTAMVVSIGFAEVLPDRVSVIAQVADTVDGLDEERARAGMTRAEEMMADVPHDIDFERARVALLRTQQMQAETRRGGGL